jgi:hypothetical protein
MRASLLHVVPIFAIVLTLATPAIGTVERYAVLVGANRGERDEPDLKYAETDAERMYAVLKEVGGFRPENMLLLRGESARVVQRSLISMNDRVRSASSRPATQVILFVYYSGHADARSLHLNRSLLELTLLEQLVRSSAAAFRVLVVDACRSGSLTRVKGGTAAPAFAVRVDETLDGEGTVFLTSSSANEDAQESDALRGSFFTHYFRSGLLGPADEDQDGRITLDEAYRYSHDSTLRASSRTLAGAQHPTFRYELRGQGKIVLTEPIRYRQNRGVLRFPPGIAYFVMVRDERGSVVGEVGARDVNRSFSVAPGRYFVRGRGSAYLLEGTVEVLAGRLQDVNDSDLTRVDYARLARKGGDERSFAHGPEAGYTLRTALANSTGLCHGAFAGYSLVFSTLTITPRIDWCRTAFENQRLAFQIDAFSAGLRAAYVWDLPVVSLEVGLESGATLHRQQFETLRNAPDRDTLGGYFGAGAGLKVDVGAGVSLFTESGAESHLFALRRSETKTVETSASFAFRQRVGISKLW